MVSVSKNYLPRALINLGTTLQEKWLFHKVKKGSNELADASSIYVYLIILLRQHTYGGGIDTSPFFGCTHLGHSLPFAFGSTCAVAQHRYTQPVDGGGPVIERLALD